jgi:hypothetical protein
MSEKATELEYLKWFHNTADFGPADGDVRLYLSARFRRETGKDIPDGYEDEE